jgi:NADH-quinone oxidoreductase subunit G
MPELTIDGQKIEVEEGTTILQAAEQLGKDIPVFCYHPGLPPDGNCRMCIVDVEDNPKLPPSCITECQDDMVVHTDNDNVHEAREGVLEFLLLNHPLDCPICDKSGECMLQDHYFDFSAERSRTVEPKVQKRKVVDVGPHIVLDTERCILCTRCIRFVENVSKEPSLGIVNRGDRAELTTFPGQELDDPYSLNTCDICPVGALTSKEFRFKNRVWFLDHTKTVCPNCSRGCSVRLDHKDGEIQRFMPRHNPHVNDFWLCDEGRLSFDWVDDKDRLETPLHAADGGFGAVSWKHVASNLTEELTELLAEEADVTGIMSTRLTNEENFQFVRLLNDELGSDSITFLDGEKGWLTELTEDDILRKSDKNPNRKGCELITDAYDLSGGKPWSDGNRSGSSRIVFLMDPMPFRHLDEDEEDAFKSFLAESELVVQVGTHRSLAPEEVDWVLPGQVWAEKEGTFTNVNGRVQHFAPAVPSPGKSRAQLQILSDLASWLDSDQDDLTAAPDPEGIFNTFANEVLGFDWDYTEIGEHGRTVDGKEDPDLSPDVKLIDEAETAMAGAEE